MYSYEFCRNDAYYGHDCPPQVPFIYNLEQEKNIVEVQAVKVTSQYWQPTSYDDEDDDEDYTIAITPDLPTTKPDNSLIMGDKHLSTIPEKEESSVEDLVPIPSEFEGIFDNMCDVPLCNNSTPFKVLKDHSEIFVNSNNDYSSSDNDSPYSEDINYVDVSPSVSELVSLKVVEIVFPKVGGIDTDILLTIKDDILCEKLLNVNLLIAKIAALKENPTPSSDLVTKSSSTSLNLFLKETNNADNSLPESETFCFNLEENSSGSPTSHSDLSLPDYEAFFCDSEPDSGDFTMDSFVIKCPIPVEDGDSYLEKFETNPELETFKCDIEEKNSGSTTIHADISLSNLKCFYFKSEARSG
ncbi:hypothetical protein Tco_1010703 [Tanacetum coccineum]